MLFLSLCQFLQGDWKRTMESRVLSGATTISAIVRMRKVARENAYVSFTRPVGSVGDGGNLIWGRQLRANLLLESSPVFSFPAGKREILRPSLAAASSPAGGSDSAGWGPFSFMWLGLGLTESCPILLVLYFVWFRFCLCREGKAAPVGFLEKYPALLTGFFFFMW